MTRTLRVPIGNNYYLVDVDMAHAHAIYGPAERLLLPAFKQQDIPFDDPNSECHFRTDCPNQLLITPGAHELYGDTVIRICVAIIQAEASQYDGLSYLQIFEDGSKPEPLWFIDDDDNGVVTVLLPSEHCEH